MKSFSKPRKVVKIRKRHADYINAGSQTPFNELFTEVGQVFGPLNNNSDNDLMEQKSNLKFSNDSSILSLAETQWLFGEWDELVKLDTEDIKKDINRSVVAVLLASAHLQTGNLESARQLLSYAQNWGCSPKYVAKILIAGINNTFGRIAALKEDDSKMRSYFEASVDIVQGGNGNLISHARAVREMTKLGLLSQASGFIQEKIANLYRFTERPSRQKAQIKILEKELRLLNHAINRQFDFAKAVSEHEYKEENADKISELEQIYTLAKQASQQSHWLKAINLWTEVQKFAEANQLVKPKEIDVQLESAILKYATKCRTEAKYREAKETLKPLLDINPHHLDALKEYARSETLQHNWMAAQDLWQKVLEIASVDIISILISKSSALRNLDLLNDAIEILESANKIGISSSQLLYHLAILKRDNHQWLEAEALVDKILGADSAFVKKVDFAVFAARVFWKSNQMSKAHKVLTDSVELNGFDIHQLPFTLQLLWNEVSQKLEAESFETSEVSKLYYDEIYTNSEKYQLDAVDSIYLPVWQRVIGVIKNAKVSSIVDIGCGPGQFAQYFHRELPLITYRGIDYSAKAIEEAKKKCPNLDFREADVYADEIWDGLDGDAFLLLEVLEHMEKDLDIVVKLPLKKLIVLSVPNFDSFGHVRFFMNEDEVARRYGSSFQHFNVETINLTGRSKIFLMVGEK